MAWFPHHMTLTEYYFIFKCKDICHFCTAYKFDLFILIDYFCTSEFSFPPIACRILCWYIMRSFSKYHGQNHAPDHKGQRPDFSDLDTELCVEPHDVQCNSEGLDIERSLFIRGGCKTVGIYIWRILNCKRS